MFKRLRLFCASDIRSRSKGCLGFRLVSLRMIFVLVLSLPVLVPILRAGLGLMNPFMQLLPTSKVGHLGLYREHNSLIPVPYYKNFPSLLEKRSVFILDPMLATGSSASKAVEQLKAAGANNITLASILAAPEGIQRLQHDHPDIRIVVATIDRQLSTKGYILPGLGDAGDRLFGTS